MFSLDWQYIHSVLPQFYAATLMTLKISSIGIVLSILLGLICSVISTYQVRILNKIVKIYIEVSRNTPLLIQLFFLYYGLPKIGIKLDGFTCGVIGLTFLGGSYMAEAFRAGLQSVAQGQIDSARSVGLNAVQVFQYVVFPQALSLSIPAIGANCLFLIKESSVLSAIAVVELLFVTKDLIGMDYKTTEALFLLILAYLIILLPVSALTSYLEYRSRKVSHGT
ncbi:putative glutamine ABC transporter permease protein GlnM [Acinetobacter calcoaceticus]